MGLTRWSSLTSWVLHSALKIGQRGAMAEGDAGRLIKKRRRAAEFQPSASFLAAGFFRPDPTILASLRQGLAADPKRWKQTTERLGAAGFMLGLDDTLVRISKGVKGCPGEIEEDLKLKSWTIRRSLSPDEISSPTLVDCVAKFARDALPLLDSAGLRSPSSRQDRRHRQGGDTPNATIDWQRWANRGSTSRPSINQRPIRQFGKAYKQCR